jgi:hypothetical protein
MVHKFWFVVTPRVFVIRKLCNIIIIIIYTRSGYEVFCNLIGSLLAGY